MKKKQCRDGMRRQDEQGCWQLYESALSQALDGVLISDARADHVPIVYANDAFLRLTGFERNEILGRSCYFPFDPGQDEIEALREAVRGAEPAKVVIRSRRKDGTMFWNDLSILPIANGQGRATHFIVLHRDVTEAVNLSAALRSATADKLAIFDNSSDIICRLSDKGIFEEVGTCITYILGWTRRELLGQHVLKIVPPARVEFVRQQLDRIRSGFSLRGIRSEYLTKDGRPVSLEWSVSRISGGGIVCVGRDVTQEKQFSSQLEYLARQDPLTDLPNRIACLQELNHLVSAEKKPRRTTALLLGLDRFKDVNESFGQEVGDDILRKLALRFKDMSSFVAFLGRLGGDEFVFVLDESNAEAAEAFAQTLMEQVAQPFEVGGREIRLDASIGVASSADANDSEALLSHASNAMIAAKATGGAGVKLYNPLMAQTKQRELQLRFDLGAALRRNEFVLHYQPKASLSTGSITGAEALIRWRHPKLGLVPPAEFIKIAEESSLVLSLGEWVIDQALSDMAHWSKEFGDDFAVSINVSPRQLADPAFPAMLMARIDAHAVLPSKVELEVTEGMLMSDLDASERVLRKIQKMGVSIALDDFGTGYSSLAYVMRIPVNTIKIDRSFVHDLHPDPMGRARMLVGTVVALCKSLGLHALAEGVETEGQRKALEQAGCDSIQGFLTSPALPSEQFFDFVKKRNAMTVEGKSGLHFARKHRLT